MAIQVSGSTVIHDSQDVQVSGMFTASSFVGDASQLTNLPASGGTLEATASGTLADGDTTVINADGTVSAVAQVGSAWIAALGGTSNDFGGGIAVDSSGNVYVTGKTESAGAGGSDFLIAKYDSSGAIQWQRTFGGTADDQGYGVTVDSSGNVYVVGFTYSAGSGLQDWLIAKYNASGTIQWQRVLGGTNYDVAQSVAVDSSGNVYVTGHTGTTGTDDDVLIVKFNASGTIQWQRKLGGIGYEYGYGIALDSSGNVYIGGQTGSTGAGQNDFLIAKYNTSGTIQWQRTLGGTGNDSGQAVAVDSSGNVYITGYQDSAGAGNYDFLIAKYNTSGTIQWQRTLGGTSSDFGRAIAVDSSGNVYVTGQSHSTGANAPDVLIAKYNTSGTIQWQRALGGTGSEQGFAITVDNLGNVYVTGQTASAGYGSNDFLIAKLPDDGSLTGTYGSFTYASSSLTDASSFVTDASSSLTDASSSLTDASSSLTDAASSLTSSTTSMTPTNLTAENFIGVSNGAYTNGQTATIQVTGSVDDAQSGLTAGQAYYVQVDGTLSETADSPSVFAGTAVSASKIIVKG